MRGFGKILIITCVFACSVADFVTADKSDCGIFGIQKWNSGYEIVNNVRETSLTGVQKILTKNDLNTAVLNLKKYCCKNNLGGLSMKLDTCDEDKDFFNENSLDSPYLFDHIFDVMMRRLNGLTGKTDIYTNMTIDETGKKWRDFINSKAKDLSGSDSQSIIKQYEDYWKTSGPKYDISDVNGAFQKSDDDFLKYVRGGGDKKSQKVAEAIQNYDKWTLYDRYKNVCALSKYFYALLNRGESMDKNVVIRRLADGSCEKMVQAQIDGENAYVQLVIQRSSNLLLTNSVKGYLGYLYDRGNKLKTLWKDTTDRWLDVVRAVPNLQKQCVK